jgi:glycine hydroxymethyltransferase
MKNLENFDKQVFDIIKKESNRQESEINLIASENYASKAVMQAVSSCFTNKYAEGNVGRRYYPGCRFADEVEQVAIDRCKELFCNTSISNTSISNTSIGENLYENLHVNVQPHSGSQANMAVYFAALNPGDTIMGMGLAEGGHLTHGHKVNFSGKFYNSVKYMVDKETEEIDYDVLMQMACEHKPKIIVAGASAYSRTIDFKKFSEIAKSVGAYLLCDIAHIAGLVAAGLHPSPVGVADFVTSTTHKTLRGPRGAIILTSAERGAEIDRAVMPGIQGGPLMNVIAAKAVAFKEALEQEFKDYQKQVIKNAQCFAKALENLGYRIVSGGTDNHMFIVDLRSKNVTGFQAEVALEKAGITVSRSCIPYDTQKPFITSGIRIGTPAITTRGMREEQVEIIASLLDEAICNCEDSVKLEKIKGKVKDMCEKFQI